MSDALLLRLAAVVFAFASGLNDGATLIAINLPNLALRPLVSLGILAAAIVAVPLVFGTLVAQTVAGRLVSFEGQGGERSFLVAVVVALLIVGLLSRRGIPTSLTLALMGAIVGTGLGQGRAVSWVTILGVTAVGIASPLASGAAGLLVVRGLGRVPLRGAASAQLRVLGALAFLLQALAYAANDGQKMIAVWAIAGGLDAGRRIVAEVPSQLMLAASFAVGTLVGIERFAGRLGRGVLPVRALHSMASEFGSASAVLLSALLGAPVSTTQASTAALVGAGVSEAIWRVRWEHATRIALAWLVTLPSSALAGALAAALLVPVT